jgi:hypothetical protein
MRFLSVLCWEQYECYLVAARDLGVLSAWKLRYILYSSSPLTYPGKVVSQALVSAIIAVLGATDMTSDPLPNRATKKATYCTRVTLP